MSNEEEEEQEEEGKIRITRSSTRPIETPQTDNPTDKRFHKLKMPLTLMYCTILLIPATSQVWSPHPAKGTSLASHCHTETGFLDPTGSSIAPVSADSASRTSSPAAHPRAHS